MGNDTASLGFKRMLGRGSPGSEGCSAGEGNDTASWVDGVLSRLLGKVSPGTEGSSAVNI